MATIRTAIELQDNFTSVMNSVINAVNVGLSTMENLQQTMNAPVSSSIGDEITAQMNQAVQAVNAARSALSEQIDIPLNPVANGNVNLDVSEQIQIPVEAVVTQQPVIDTPEQIEVPVSPVITEQVQIDVPGEITVDVNPVVTETPDLNIPDSVTVEVNAETETAAQRISNIEQQLQGVNRMQEAINSVAQNAFVLPDDTIQELNSVNREIRRMQAALEFIKDNPFEMDASFATMQIDSLTRSIEGAIEKQQELNSQLGNLPEQIINVQVNPDVPDPLVDQPAPVQVPVHWESDNLEVFTSTGVERFQQEVQSANNMLNTLNNTQQQIAATAAQTNLFPANAVADMNTMQTRLTAIQQRIQAIESNPLNMGTDTANAELEQLREQLQQAVTEQENLNRAVESMDVQAANEAYLRLSQTVANTERYIRDNVNEQGRFNREIEDGAVAAGDLMQMLKGAVAAYTGVAGIRKAFSFVQDCTELFNTQLNAENQLMVVLGNMLDEDYVSQFTIETTADTTAAVNEINAIQGSIDEVVVPVTAEGKALQAEFDKITAKASEIQGKGIYGDEAMIAGAAEFATYFSDVEAITMMMDTLSNYAMGMSGGGALDASSMVDYATGLGKIMSGSYDAMTKKGFEFSDAQKAIIEGTATEEQIVAILGDEYAAMSQEMQAAAAISQVIEEGWGGLYETMSNTPEGKIIQLNNAWGDMKEVIGGQLYPYVLLFVDAITENWGTIETIVSGFATALEYVIGVLSVIMEAAINFAQVIMDNWSWISPIIYGIAAALAVYGAYLAITKGIEIASAAVKGIMAIAEGIHAAAIWATTSATWAEVTAQNGLNAAMYACPIVWIIVLVIALIALFYAAVAAVNKFAGTSVSATGIICGALAAAGAFIWNLVLGALELVIGVLQYLINPFINIANFIGNVFTSPISSIIYLFQGMADTVLSILQKIASALDFVFGSNMAGTVQSWRDGLKDAADAMVAEYAPNENYQQVMSTLDFSVSDLGLDRIAYADAWDAGYSFGEGIDESIANFDPSNLFGTTDIPSPEDYANNFTGIDGIGSGVEDIAGNTGKIADGMDITEEDLKYLRDIAEQEAINRFTTAEIYIDQSGMQNTINKDMDLDGVVSGLTDAVNEAVDIIAEGVHA